MKIFITGGAGLLGSMLLRSAHKKVKLFTSYHENKLIPKINRSAFLYLDIRDKKNVDALVNKIKPQVIIHTAAKGSPDFCEFNQKDAWDINVEGTRNILLAGKNINAKVIFTSSNQVFSGKKPPYSENSPLDPVNFYGKTKVESEKDVHKNKNAIIARLMTMYGWANPAGQNNTGNWVVNMLSKKEPIKVVDDIYNNFLWVGQAADALWKLALGKYDLKLVNIAGGETANRFDFAVKVAKAFNLDTKLISPVRKSYFKEEAPRPMNTIYNIALFKKTLKIKALSLNEGLRAMRKLEKGIKWQMFGE